MTPLHAFEGFGLEVEYMIVDRLSLSVHPIADRFLAEISAQPQPQSPLVWSNELALHAVELKNPSPVPDLATLHAAMKQEIQRANTLLALHGAVLMPGAMHPWMNPADETRLWPGAHAEIYAAYDRIFNCKGHGWANIQSAQLNLAFANDEEFARQHAAARLIAPIIPALAAGSPVVEGRYAGFQDYRMHAYCTHQARVLETIGNVIPDTCTSRADFERNVLTPMFSATEALDNTGTLRAEWLNVRAVAPRFSRNALELRNIDSQECPQADLAIAKAISAAIHGLYQSGPPLQDQQAISTDTLATIHKRCIREASCAMILDPDYLALLRVPTVGLEAGQIWRHLLARASKNGTQFDATTERALSILLKQGPLAVRILRALGEDFSRRRLEIVWRQMCRCLQDDTMFCSPERT